MQDVGARTLVTPPAAEPFTVAEVKLQLRISTSTEDALITRNIAGVRRGMEAYLRRALITQTWKVCFERFPCYDDREIELPYPELQSVTHVKYRDTNGDQITLDSSTYEVLTNTLPGKIALLPGQIWPVTQYQRSQPVEIQFVAGYGANGASIPEPIMNAMLLQLGDLYENRQEAIIGTIATSIPTGAKEYVSQFRCLRFF